VPSDHELRIVPPHHGVDEAIPVVGQWATKERGNGARDLACIELDSQTARRHGLAAISLDSVKPFHRAQEGHLYLAQGLPHGLGEVSAKLDGKTLALSSVSYLTDPVPSASQGTVDLTLHYKTGVTSPTSVELDLPDPPGVSGGGIWLAANRGTS